FIQAEPASRVGLIQALDAQGDNMGRFVMLLFICLISACATQSDMKSVATSQDQCLPQPERERLLALNENDFDQDLSGGGAGWRAVAAKAGCEIAAANLIRDYRERHSSEETIIYWHEGQMRAFGNDYVAAIALFEKSRKPKEQDGAGWNEYVDASIAFLERDMHALKQARDALSAVKASPEFDLKDGVFEIPNNSGKPFKMRWPPNIDVLDGLIKCFEKSYRDAYNDATCRPAAPA
ncbi:MAG: hypothetical protein ABJA62_07785, partial [Luteimonas sp.]